MSSDDGEKYRWVKAADGNIPEGAFVGGHDNNSDEIYVARAQRYADIIPGKLVANHVFANVPWAGEEILERVYEVLVNEDSNLKWKASSGSYIPRGAILGGRTHSGEILYVGRVRHEGSVTPGKVQKSHGVCYIAFGGKELAFSKYEILIHK